MSAAIQILSLAQLALLPEPTWLIKGVLEQSSLASLYGPSDSGKSFVAVSMACAIAGGWNWCNRQTHRGDVVYVCAEGHGAIFRRIRAYCQDAGRRMPDRLFIIPQAVEVATLDTIEDVVSKVEELGIDPALIVIDTLARCFGNGDENSTKDMNAFVIGCVALQQAFPDCTIVVVHHTGYDTDHARGSTVLKAAVDTEIGIRRVGPARGPLENLDLVISKMKNFANDNRPLHLKLVDVDVPASDGLPSTHSAVVRLAGSPPPRKEKPANENEERVMAALSHAPAGLTPKEVRETSGVRNEDTCRSVMERLRDKGKVYKKGLRWFAGAEHEPAAAA